MDDIKKILKEYFTQDSTQEVLKFMSEPEQRRAYETYLDNGNYNIFSAFIEEFQEGVFDTVTGKAVNLSEQVHESALRNPNLNEGLAKAAADLSQVMGQAKRDTVDLMNTYFDELSSSMYGNLEEFAWVLEDMMKLLVKKIKED